MKKIYVLLIAFLSFAMGSFAQLTGTKNIPGDYATLALAITDLNTQGVGAGGVIFNVVAGNPQSAPVGGYSITTTTGTAANTIVFTGNGNTVTAFNPQASGALNDAVIKLIGADYITIQGFTIQENAANTTTAAGTNNMTEWGIALLYASATNGAQNNTIQNNTISLNRTYQNSFGIYSNVRHTSTAVTTTADITNVTGSNAFNKVYTNTISNVNYGIVFIGCGSTTTGLMDNGNDIGGTSPATGNTISNSGGIGTAPSGYVALTGNNYLIFSNNQYNDNISYNNITSATGTSGLTMGGILKNYSTGTTAQPTGTITTAINNNTVSIVNNASAAGGAIIGINNQGLSPFLGTATMSMNNNTVQNCTLGGTTVTTGGLTAITNLSLPGTLNMNNNIVTNLAITATTSTTGGLTGITNSGAAGVANMNGNTLTGFSRSAGTTGQITGLFNTGAIVTTLNMNNNFIGTAGLGFMSYTYNGGTGALFGLGSQGSAATCTATIQNNDIRGITYSVDGTNAHQYLSCGTGTPLNLNVSNNTFTNLTARTSGTALFFAQSYTMPAGGSQTFNNNSIVTAYNKTVANGTVTLFSTAGSSPNGSTATYTNNNFSNISVLGTAGITGITNTDGAGTSPTKTVTGNTFNNWSAVTGAILGMSFSYIGGTTTTIANNSLTGYANQTTITGLVINNTFAGSGTLNINNNAINSYTSSGTGGTVQGITCSNTSTNVNIFSHAINGLSSTGATVNGIVVSGATTTNIYKNNVYNLSSSNNGGVVLSGITISGGTTVNTYNNFVSDLRAPAASNAIAIYGINNSGGSTVKMYYNTIALGKAAVLTGGAQFGVTGIGYATTTNAFIANNIIWVDATPTGTAAVACIRRAANGTAGTAPATTNFNSVSNNNILYVKLAAGAPPVAANINKYLYLEGNVTTTATNGYGIDIGQADVPAQNLRSDINFNTSCGLYKTFMGGRESATFNEDNLVSAPSTTFVPSGTSYAAENAQVISTPTITDDYNAVTRSATTPDIGALEFSGTGVDASGPSITYTPLPNTLCLTGPTLNAVISDPSGVNVTTGTAPRLYYRKGGATAEADVFLTYPAQNTSGFNGWKYVEATGTAPNFSFAIDYSLLTSAMAVGDSLTYFVMAQDLAGTPNVGKNQVTFSGTFCPTSVDLSGITNTTSLTRGYKINPSIPTAVTIGAAGTYTSISGAGGLFADINVKGLSGNTVATIIDASVTETGANALNAMAACGGPYTLTIKPQTTSTLTGSVASGALIKLNGASNVIIDGSNSGGTDRSLTITNTATTAPSVVSLISLGTGLGASNNTIKNCNISTGVATSIGYGIAVGGATPGTSGADNDNVTIENNNITAAPIGIYAAGTASVSAGGDDNLNVVGNTVDYNSTLASIGIQLGNALSSSVSGNTVSGQTTTTAGPTAISLETGFVSSSVTRNFVTKALATNTGGYAGRGITVGTGTATSNLTIANNVIYGVNGSNWSSFGNASSMGISIGVIGNSTTLTTTAGGINLYYNSVNMTGSMGSGSTSALTTALYVGTGASALNVRNNVLANTMTGTSTTQKNYAIYSAATASPFAVINNNDYYVANSFNAASAIVGSFNAVDRTNLVAWQGATGQDVNSISADPLFNSTTNLQPQLGSPTVNAGTPITGITTDILGTTRNATTPTIGAYETAIDVVGPVITYVPATTLPNTAFTCAPTVSVTITDASGVNTTAGTKPRLWYKYTTVAGGTHANANTLPATNDNTTDGWKYIEYATNAGSTYTFNVDYNLLNGGLPVAGDSISYFFNAQDLAAIPNVGSNAVTYAATPTSVALTAAAFPVTGVNGYKIIAVPTLQPSVAAAQQGAVNQQILRIDVPASSCAGTLTQIDFGNLSGTLSDVSAARVFYTTTPTFATTTQFGSDVLTPGATFTVNGTQLISSSATNYFWLVFDVNCAATVGNLLDASVTNMTIGGSPYVPSPANPTGTRTIAAAVIGDNITEAPTAAFGLGATNAYTISGKSLEVGEPSPILNSQGGGGNGQSNYSWGTIANSTAWYKFVVPTSGYGSSGNLAIWADTSAGSTSDNQVAIWEFPSMPSGCGLVPNFTGAKLLAANDDRIVTNDFAATGEATFSTLNAVVRTRLTPGNTYYVQIDGYANSSPFGNLYIEDLAAAPYNIANNGLGNYHNPSGVDMRFGAYEVNGTDGWTYYYENNGTANTLTDDKVLLATKMSADPNFYYAGTYLPGTVMSNHLKRGARDMTPPSNGNALVGADSIVVWSGRNSATGASANLKATAPYVAPQITYWYMMNKFWNFIPKNQPSAPVGVRMFYSDADYNSTNAAAAAGGFPTMTQHTDLRFLKFTKSATTHYTNAEVDPAGGQALITAGTAYYYGNAGTASTTTWANTDGVEAGADPINQAEFQVTSFSGGGGGTSIGNPLPIVVNYLNGIKQGNNHNLNWKITCISSPSATMVLERSGDNRIYTAINTVNADAARCAAPFSYVDASPLAGINYYRIRITDAFGKVTFSNTIAMVNKQSGIDIVNIVPNPVKANSAILNVASAQQGVLRLVITDVTGRKLAEQTEGIIAGSNQINLNLAKLAAGTYQVTAIQQDGSATSIRFVKQ